MAKAQMKKAVAAKKIVLPKAQLASTKDMLGKVVVLVLRCRHFQAERGVRQDQIKAEDAKKGWVKGRKRLLDSPKLNEINHVLHEARTWLRRIALPSPIADSVYFVPKGLAEQAEAKLTELKKRHAMLVNEFAEDEYEPGIKDARTALGKLFNEKDYVGKDGVRSLFSMEWEYESIDVPVSLADVSEKLYKREQAKAEKKWEAAEQAWLVMLREEFSGIVSHMVERLTPAKDGKKKIFRDTAFTKVTDWAEAFNPRNIHNDVQLKALVDQAKGLLKGSVPEALRDDDLVREQVRKSFQAIKNTLDTMVTEKPSREVSFEDD